ncbi:hypothetical protein RH915_03995 [Serpentinicella sp. ANB-PHB4]|uniref:hypothetical protein n=1 Tax=Serpentinicella sp. ANB-PHB4 TaxID=3074076 RepID=UPI0028662AF5|nr:hypothetical protein [Serpentinicella sp. ANB-PHB4]MDR5658643.1 hypothetical protein [Serpentinicella sp. ANB-PHB4]
MKRTAIIMIAAIFLILGAILAFTRTGIEEMPQDDIIDEINNEDDGDQERMEDTEEQAIEEGASIEQSSVLEPYFLTEQGVRLNFSGEEGYAHADRIMWVAHRTDNLIQQMEETAATTVAKIYQLRENEIALIVSEEEVYDDRDLTTDLVEIGEERIILREPLEVGNQWQDERMTYEIEAIDKEITVPYGTFNTIRVREISRDEESENIVYYASELGMIRSVFKSDAFEVVIELESVQE